MMIHDNEVFHDEITIDEKTNAIMKSSNNKSFDIDDLHATMIKNLCTKATFFLMTILNAGNIMCGHGRSHESSSYANQTKRDMMNALHIDHSQLPVISAKRWKQNLQLESHLDVNGLLGDKQGVSDRK